MALEEQSRSWTASTPKCSTSLPAAEALTVSSSKGGLLLGSLLGIQGCSGDRSAEVAPESMRRLSLSALHFESIPAMNANDDLFTMDLLTPSYFRKHYEKVAKKV